MRNKMNAHTLSRAHKKHIWCYKLKARTTTSIATKKNFTMRIRQNPNSNYFNSMFAHYVVLAMLPLCVCFQSLDEWSRSQSRHARRVESSRRSTGMFAYMWEYFEVVFSLSFHVCIFSDDDHTLDRAKSYYIHKFFEFLFAFSTHNEMVHLKRI